MKAALGGLRAPQPGDDASVDAMEDIALADAEVAELAGRRRQDRENEVAALV